MEIFDGQYYNISKWFLELIGLWPYQSQYRRHFSILGFFLINCTVVLPQILRLIRSTSNFNILVENSLSILFTIACFSKYAVMYFSRSRLKSLLAQIEKDWQKVTEESEVEIMSKYGQEGRLLVLFYACYVFFAWAMFNMLPFLPPILDVVFPLSNGTYGRVLPFHADYVFFDQNDYHYEACLHVFIVYFATTSLFAGMDTLYVATVKHSCGLFAVTWLETMGKKFNRVENLDIKPNLIIQKQLASAVMLHSETISCVELLENSFSFCFLLVQCLVVIGIATLSFYMLQVYEQTFNMVRFAFFTLGLVIHLLYLNWVGQKIIDGSSEVFISVYFSDWYLISKEARHLTKIIMTRSLYPCHLTAGKIIVLSMETFGALMKTSMSYFTVLLSVA